MTSRDAGSFTSAYSFESDNKVKIECREQGAVLKKSSTTGDMYEVMLDGTEFIITVRAERLIQFKKESETESESRSTSSPRAQSELKLQQTINCKGFVAVQSDDISNLVNQQKNRNTLSKTLYNRKLFISLLHQETINEHRPYIYEIFKMLQLTRDCPILMVKSRCV